MVKKKVTFRKYDASRYLDNEERIAAYLSEVFTNGTEAEIKRALSDVARARSMSEIAKRMNVSRPSLYKSLSGDTRVEFETIRKFLKAIGVSLAVVSDPSS